MFYCDYSILSAKIWTEDGHYVVEKIPLRTQRHDIFHRHKTIWHSTQLGFNKDVGENYLFFFLQSEKWLRCLRNKATGVDLTPTLKVEWAETQSGKMLFPREFTHFLLLFLFFVVVLLLYTKNLLVIIIYICFVLRRGGEFSNAVAATPFKNGARFCRVNTVGFFLFSKKRGGSVRATDFFFFFDVANHVEK